MDIATIGGFALTGALVSALVQYTKGFIAKKGNRTLYVIGISVIGGLVAYFFHLVPTDIVETVLGVWASANTVYIAVAKFLPASPTMPSV